MPEVDFEQLLDKYMYHVSRFNRGNVFVGVGYEMTGFSPEEINALHRSMRALRHDLDLHDEMTLGHERTEHGEVD